MSGAYEPPEGAAHMLLIMLILVGCVHIGWDTTAEEVMLEFSREDGKEIEEVTLTTDYFKLPFDADWLKEIPGNEKITATVSNTAV